MQHNSFQSYCCTDRCWSGQQTESILITQRINGRNKLVQQQSTSRGESSNTNRTFAMSKPAIRILSNNTSLNKLKECKTTYQSIPKFQPMSKNINQLKQTHKPSFAMETHHSYNINRPFLKSEQVSILNSPSTNKQFLNLPISTFNSIIGPSLHERYYLEKSVGASTKMIESNNNFTFANSPNCNNRVTSIIEDNFNTDPKRNITKSNFTKACQTPTQKTIQREVIAEKNDQSKSIKSIKSITPLVRDKKIWNFRQIRTIVSNHENSANSEQSEILFRNSGKLTSLQFRQQNLRHKFEQTLSNDAPSFIKKSHTNFYSNDLEMLFSKDYEPRKTIQVEILNEQFVGSSFGHSLDCVNKKKRIYSGKESTIYFAEDSIGFIFAIKQIQKSRLKKSKNKNDLLNELKIHMSVSHPNIIQLYGVRHDDNYIQLYLELGERSLKQLLLQHQSFDEIVCLQFLFNIMKAVLYLHDRNIVHRNINPENIILTHGICKLTDFGQATIMSQNQQQIAYISPEMQDLLIYSKKMDCWAVGVIAYQLAFGKLPFASQELQYKLIFDSHRVLSDNYKQLLTNLLEKDFKKRASISDALSYQCFLRFN